MSRLKSNGAGTADLGAVISQIKTRIAEQGSNFASKEVTSNVLSMESIFTGHDITARDTLERTSDSIVRELKTAYQAANVSLESISAAQWEAGAMAAMAVMIATDNASVANARAISSVFIICFPVRRCGARRS